MTSVPVTTARKNLFQLIAEVNENSTPVTLTNARGKNAVLIAESDWSAIQETLYIQSIPGLTQKILNTYSENVLDGESFDPDEAW